MARYDYRCPSCGTTFEVEHGMTEHPAVACPACGAEAEKVFTASGIKFAGSGFYNTDQRGGGFSTEATSGNGADADEGSSSDASSNSDAGSSSSGARESGTQSDD